MSSDLLALPVLATWGLIDLAARLALRVYSPAVRTPAVRPLAPVPAGAAPPAPVQLGAARERRAGLVAVSSGRELRSAS